MSSLPILVYAGKGSSHSWTWLADLLETSGNLEARFLGTEEFVDALSDRAGVVIISGGDGFSIASALSGKGFRLLTEHIERGGAYVGICAGAYLPLRSSIPPFSEFNLLPVKIENMDHKLTQLDNVPPRVAVRYGACSIVHPVRGEVAHSLAGHSLIAPLYGGPVFGESSEAEVLTRYLAFTENTEFQMPRRLARSIVLGKPSAVKARYGEGSMTLLGPHLEHPRYPLANDVFLRLVGLVRKTRKTGDKRFSRQGPGRAIVDLKVAVVGLENRSFVVGRKLWDGSRYLELADAISRRSWTLDSNLANVVREDLEKVRVQLTALKMGIETEADETTELLVETARKCVDNHFREMS